MMESTDSFAPLSAQTKDAVVHCTLLLPEEYSIGCMRLDLGRGSQRVCVRVCRTRVEGVQGK